MHVLRSLSVSVLALALAGGGLLLALRGLPDEPGPRPTPTGVAVAVPPQAVDPNAAQVQPGDPRWKRFALVLGLQRLAEHPTLAPTPEQAERVGQELEALRRADGVNDFLFTRFLQILTPEQVRYMADNVRRPKGACTCPCSTWDPLLVGATSLLKQRSGGAAATLELPADLEGEEDESDLEARLNAPETLILLQGITRVERLEELRLTPEQSRQLLPVVEKMTGTLAEIEKRMHAVEAALTPEQVSYIHAEGASWFGDGATAASLNERWEEWLQGAIDAMARRSGGVR